MALSIEITPADFVSDIVNRYYNTADVFRKYGIDYCCGAKFSIEDTCFARQINASEVVFELNKSVNAGHLSLLNTSDWNTDFQVDFIVNVHHAYLKQALPDIQSLTRDFTNKHRTKFSHLLALNDLLDELVTVTSKWMALKENTLFPYLKRMAHAYQDKESYAGLMIRTLQKPVNNIIPEEHKKVTSILSEVAALTDNYTVPTAACTSHKITFYKLQQLSKNVQQQLYLENAVLYPQVLLMEKEILEAAR
ncbi:MAG: DUF542 domain-containing protein [Agriterribacter sp.]